MIEPGPADFREGSSGKRPGQIGAAYFGAERVAELSDLDR
jgi:hypothetical protein